MRIVFMGGKNIGCGCLKYLIEREEDRVVGIIVNPSDTAKDRWYESATELGIANNIPVYLFENINSPESVSLVRELSPDIIVVVYYDQILKKDIIHIPPKGCINLHMALAEEYRGCYPTTWAIINGEKRTGVTLHYIDEGIDSGDIIAQREVTITDGDTGKSLYKRCTKTGLELFREQFPLISSGKAARRKQATTAKTKYYKREFPSRELDFSRPGREIFNHIRALLFEPFPPPFFRIGNRRFIIKEEKD
jgi:methionyl-tRNA formyltransferase